MQIWLHIILLKSSGGSNNSNRGGFVNRGGGNGFRGGRGRGRNSNRHIYYQLCGKASHFVDWCYYRFDKNFQKVTGYSNVRSQGGNVSVP